MRTLPLNDDQTLWNAIRECLGLTPLYDPGDSRMSDVERFGPFGARVRQRLARHAGSAAQAADGRRGRRDELRERPFMVMTQTVNRRVTAAVDRVMTSVMTLRAMVFALFVSAACLLGCGAPFTPGIGPDPRADAQTDAPPLHEAHPPDAHADAGSDAVDPPDARRDAHHDAAGGPETSSSGDDADPGDAMPPADVVLVDSGHDSGHDAGCAPPTETSGTCDGIPYAIPSQICIYDWYTSSYTVIATPAGCRCGDTYNCTCLEYLTSNVCGGFGGFVGCSGTPPQVSCN